MDIVQLAKPTLTRRQRWQRAAAVVAAGALVLGLWETGAWYAQRPPSHFPLRVFAPSAAELPRSLVPVPLIERDVVVDGTRIHYVEGGSGPPVVFCHGWKDNHRVWFRNLQPIATVAHVYALDWPGFGLSDKAPEGRYDPATQSQLLAGFLDALGLEEVALVGHSMGGHWTTTFLLAHPGRVTRYVGVASAAMLPGPPAYRLPLMRWGVTRYLHWRAARPDARAAAMRDWTRILMGSEVITDDFLAQVSNFDTRGDPASVPISAAALTGIARLPLRTQVHRITTPTLLIWGDRDHVVPVRYGRHLARALPDARLVVMAGVGHAPFLQEPDAFTRLVGQFLGLLADPGAEADSP